MILFTVSVVRDIVSLETHIKVQLCQQKNNMLCIYSCVMTHDY